MDPCRGIDGLRIALAIAAVVGSLASIPFLLSAQTLRADLALARA
ncbi:MAG: hypothetical protein VCC00_07260 [Deltaproteobacteria bacterium]